MIKIRDLFGILFIIILSSPLFTYGNNNPTDYNVVMVIQDDSSFAYDIIKINEMNESNPVKIERCSENCEKINEFFRFIDLPSKEYISFKIKLDYGPKSYSFKFKSKQALIACKKTPIKFRMFYNDGRFSGELEPSCDNEPYSLLQRDKNDRFPPRVVVDLSKQEENIKKLKEISKIEYSTAYNKQNTEKYYESNKAWDLLENSKSLCKNNNNKDSRCIAWCWINKKAHGEEAFNIKDIDRCDFNDNGEKVISFYPKKEVCDPDEIDISSYKSKKDKFSLGAFRSTQKKILKQPPFCPIGQKVDKNRMEIDKGISLTPIYIDNETQRFWRHIDTDVYFEIEQPGDSGYEIIDLFERFENDTMLKLTYVSKSEHRTIAEYYDYVVRKTKGGIYPNIVYENYHNKRNNHLIYITNNFKKEKHIKYLLTKRKNKVIYEKNTVTFVLIDEDKSAQKKVDELKKEFKEKKFNFIYVDWKDRNALSRLKKIIEDGIDPDQSFADDDDYGSIK